MKTMSKVLRRIAENDKSNEISSGSRVGFWLVRDFDKERFYISEDMNELALNKVCDKVLSDKTGYGYWIDYCLGLDISGRVAWSNIDQTDRFI